MTYRFVVNTAYGVQNFLTIKETKKGDLIVSERFATERLDLSQDELQLLSTDPGEREIESITVHPNLMSQNGTITVNYKIEKMGEKSYTVTSALEVRQGLRLFPVLSSIGSNIASPRLIIDRAKYKDDTLLELWSDQQFDWTIQSLAYCVFVANPDIAFVLPQNFPREVHYLRFEHLQLIFMYWTFDQPTKGAGTTLRVFAPNGQALPGFELNEAAQLTVLATKEHTNHYARLPEFLPGQLPPKFLPHTGVQVIPSKWHFKNFSFGVETHRDESLLRLKFHNSDGNVAVVDLNGEGITEFQNTLNHAIKVVPGLTVWKKPNS
jgi:hypothetical protein